MNTGKRKLLSLNAGKSLRIIMEEWDITAGKLAIDRGVSDTTVSSLRKNKLISGKNLVMLSDYFGMTAGDFIRKGEE